jgi:uncharacterized protein (TIGR03437 family)
MNWSPAIGFHYSGPQRNNTNRQLLVQRDNTYASPLYVDVAATQPGVLEYGQQQGIAVDLSGNLNGPSNPAHAGDVLILYCLGPGAMTPAVADRVGSIPLL